MKVMEVKLMPNDIMFYINSFLLGIGLSMDAFSISLVNGLNEPKMKKRKVVLISSTFASFQALMPFIGWLCVHLIAQQFAIIDKIVPYVALVLLTFIGIKMIVDSVKNKSNTEFKSLKLTTLLIQAIATSIDALSVGFTIADYNWLSALICVLIIALVTFIVCLLGVLIGKKFGASLSNKATMIGGIILILIGIEIFLTNIL